MPTRYEFEGTQHGKKVKGTISADSLADARRRLEERDIVIIALNPVYIPPATTKAPLDHFPIVPRPAPRPAQVSKKAKSRPQPPPLIVQAEILPIAAAPVFAPPPPPPPPAPAREPPVFSPPPVMATQVNTAVHVHGERPVNGLGVASLVMGIVALLFCWIPVVGMLAAPIAFLGGLLAIVGFLIAAIGGRSGIGLPISGLVTCGLAFVIGFGQAAVIFGATGQVIKDEQKRRQAAEERIPRLAIGERATVRSLRVTPTAVVHRRLKHPPRDLFGGRELIDTEGPVLCVLLRLENLSQGQVFQPLPANERSDRPSLTDSFDNVDIGSLCDMDPQTMTGSAPADIKPGGFKVAAVWFDSVKNLQADHFEIELNVRVDNRHRTETVKIVFAKSQIQE